MPYLLNFLPERKNGANRHLEMLHAPGNSHDGEAEDDAKPQVNQCNLPPAHKNPDKIHDDGYAARLVGAVHQFFAEGP